MVKTLNTPSNSLHKRQGKDKHFEVQIKQVFAALKRKPSTMLMVSSKTGVLRANICRYVTEWENQNCIRKVPKGIYQISKHLAGYYTTNPEMFPAIVESSNTVKP